MNGSSPSAVSPQDGAANLLECALGRCSSDVLMELQSLVGFDAEGAAWRVAAGPDVWTDGSLVEDKVSGASSAGAGCLYLFAAVVFGQVGGVAMSWFLFGAWSTAVCSEG